MRARRPRTGDQNEGVELFPTNERERRPVSARGGTAGYAAGFLVAIAVSLVLPVQAQAQTVTTLVSNLAQSVDNTQTDISNSRAQAFTTGANPVGLASVDINYGGTNAASAAIWTTESDGTPAALLYQLTPPGSFSAGTLTFTAPADATLSAQTTYSVVLTTTGTMDLRTTLSDNEDSGAADAWSIHNSYHFVNNSNSWQQTSSGRSYMIAIKGTIVTPPTSSALVSNLGQTGGSFWTVGGSSSFVHAQRFTTGDNADGYTLYSVQIGFGNSVPSQNAKVSIYSTDTSDNPASSLLELTNPASVEANEVNTFTAGTGLTLLKETDYFIVVEATTSTSFNIDATSSTAEDAGAASGWSISDDRRRSSSGTWGSVTAPLLVAVTGALGAVTLTSVGIDAQHESIGGGLEDLVFTLTREGATTAALDATVTLTQAESWLGDSDLSHEVTFSAGDATETLTIAAGDFSFTPTATGTLTATVSGDGITGGSDMVEIISISVPPITVSYDMTEYTFAEDATDPAIYAVATLNAAYPRPPSSNNIDVASVTSNAGTATGPEDYVAFSVQLRVSPSDFDRDSDTDPHVARRLISELALVDDDIYEGSESFEAKLQFLGGIPAGLVRFAHPDGTTCLAAPSCEAVYPVNITDEEDLPVLSVSASPTSITEEDDATTAAIFENVSTVTVEITNGKTFARDTTVTLAFTGTATLGTHYAVSPTDEETDAGHQVTLPKETAAVQVTVTATGNTTADNNRTVIVAGDLGGTAIGTSTITILDNETTTNTVPGKPTGLTATADGTTTIDLAWTAPSDNGGSDITGYRIEISPNGTSNWTDHVAHTNSTATSYSHTGLDPGTTRHYRVSAINGVGTGEASDSDNATTSTTVPGKPTGLTATADGTGTIDLEWAAPSSTGGSPITGYKIEISPDGTSNWTELVANTNSTGTTYSHTGLSPGTTRHYRVSAINDNGDGAASDSDSATTDSALSNTVPDEPTGLTATASGTGTIDLDWTAPSNDGGSAITGYRIEFSSDGNPPWTNHAVTSTPATTYSHTGLSPGTTRHYRVSALNGVGFSDPSNIDHATTGTTATTVPGEPTGLTATADGTGTINLAWTAPSNDGGSTITGYRIEVSPDGATNWTNRVANTGSTATSYSHTGLSPSTTRHYRVSARNANGAGEPSNIANATTGTTGAVPGEPTGLTATASGTGTINLAWNAPARDGGSTITGYRIEVSSDGSNWTNRVANTGSTATSYSHTGLSPGTTRRYRVSARNVNGAGAPSNTAIATTGTDDDAGALVLTVEALDTEVTEGEPVRYRIHMSRATSGAVVASLYRYEGHFVPGRPTSVVTEITSQGSQLYRDIEVATLDDAVHEEDGSLTVRLWKPESSRYEQGEEYTLGSPSTARVTILDNDPEDTEGVPVVTMADHTVSVVEGPDAELVFPVSLDIRAVTTAKVHYKTLDSGAEAGKDYKEKSGTLVFSPGQKEKEVRVEIIDDTEVEGTERLLLLLTGGQGVVIDDAVAVGKIVDNDASSDGTDGALEEALAVAAGLTPDEAARALFGEAALSEARLAALDRLGNRNGRYDLGDLLAWIDRCRRGEARCGATLTDAPPPSAAGLAVAAVAAGRPRISRRTRRRGSGRRGRAPIPTARRRRGRFAGYALAALLAAATTLSCADGPAGPAAYVPDPGLLTVEWSGPVAASRDVGVLLELDGPTIEAVRAPGLELYESTVPGPQRIVVAGPLEQGPLVQFRVPDRNRSALYRVRVIEVTGDDYQLRDPAEYRAVIISN